MYPKENPNLPRMGTEKEKNLGQNVRKYLREYSEVSGIQGLRYIAEKRSRCEKIVWAIVLIISLCGCIYMIYEILEKYENTPVVVSLSSQDTPVYEIPFPAVTICLEQQYSREKFDYTDAYNKVLRDEKLDPEEEKTYNHLNLLCNEQDPGEKNKTVGEDLYDTFDKLKLNQSVIFRSCYFINKYYDCDEFITPVLIDAGICYSFNLIRRDEIFRKHVFQYKDYNNIDNTSESFDIESGYSKNAGIDTYPRRGLATGLQPFEVMIQYNHTNSDRICNTFFDGFKVLIHNSWDIPQLEKHHILVPPGKLVFNAIEPEMIATSETVRKFKPEKRKCFMKDERPLQHFRFYTQSNCLLECLTNFTLNKCGCVSFAMPRNKTTPICGPGSWECASEANGELKHTELEYKLAGKTFCDCKPGCTNLNYNVETTTSHFYFKEFFLVKNKSFVEDGVSMSVVQVYFKNEQFLKAERNELYGISNLISNLGGLLGLFTGFSLISGIEIIYFCTLRIFYNVKMYGDWSGPPR